MHICDLQYWRLSLRHPRCYDFYMYIILLHTALVTQEKPYPYFVFDVLDIIKSLVRSGPYQVLCVKSNCQSNSVRMISWCQPSWVTPPAAGQHFVEWSAALPPTFLLELETNLRKDFTITEKAPPRAFSFSRLKAPSAFTFKTLLRHYAERALTPWSLNMKLGPQRNYHKGQAAIRHYANQTARPLWPLRRGPNFTLRDRGVNAHLA